MATCKVCGNQYDKAFPVDYNGSTHTFDSFDCAVQKLAPHCVDGLVVDDQVRWGKDAPDFFTHAIQTERVTELRLENVDGTANPNCEDCEAIKLIETTQSE